MSSPSAESGSPLRTPNRVRAVGVPIVFVVLALVLGLGPWSFESPVPPPAKVPDWFLRTATVRHPTLAPTIVLAGRTYHCSECHKLFAFREDPPLLMHDDIVLAHGINNRCLNCHHATDRDMLAGNREEKIPFDKPQLLCAKCHGPVYRDWLNRAHGRTNGYWDPKFGPRERRLCVECHDPHQPPFPPMPPAPPPRTLRMGDQHIATEHEADPLRVEQRVAPAERPRGPDAGHADGGQQREHTP